MMIKQVSLSVDNYGISKFLFYKASGREAVDHTEIDRLKNSRIPGLLPCIAIQMEDNVTIRYELISEKRLSTYLTKLTRDNLYICLMDVIETFIQAAKLGLNTEQIVLNMEQIFIDRFSNRLLFVYLPVKNNRFEKRSLKEFIEGIITVAPYDETSDARFFIRLHNYIHSKSELDPAELAERLRDWADDDEIPNRTAAAAPAPKRQPQFYSPGSTLAVGNDRVGVQTSVYSSEKKDKRKGGSLEIEEEVQYKRITRTELGESGTLPALPINITFDHDDDEGTTVLGIVDEDEGTTTLGVVLNAAPKPFLLTVADNEKIIISKDLFKIGRDPQQSDYTSPNSAIGRVHAYLITENGEYYFEDNRSTNGSYVNGHKVDSKRKVKIKHEDMIKLANEEFIFRLF